MSTLGKGRHSDAEITKRYDRSFKTGIELVTWDILGMNWRLSLEGWWDISRKGEQCQQLPLSAVYLQCLREVAKLLVSME